MAKQYPYSTRWAVEINGKLVPKSEFPYKRDTILYASVLVGRDCATLAELKKTNPEVRIVRVKTSMEKVPE